MSRRCHTVLVRNDRDAFVLGLLVVGQGVPQGSLYPEALLVGESLL